MHIHFGRNWLHNDLPPAIMNTILKAASSSAEQLDSTEKNDHFNRETDRKIVSNHTYRTESIFMQRLVQSF